MIGFFYSRVGRLRLWFVGTSSFFTVQFLFGLQALIPFTSQFRWFVTSVPAHCGGSFGDEAPPCGRLLSPRSLDAAR